MKYTGTYIIVGFLLLTNIGCNSWLDLDPVNQRVSSDYWNTKEEVKNTTISCYTSLRLALERIVQWGEVRSVVLDLQNPDPEIEIFKQQQDIRDLNISSENPIVSWKEMYKVINIANTVISKAPTVLLVDPTFKREEMLAYQAEAKFVRALCYFYLVKSFRDVPLVLEHYEDDSKNFEMVKSADSIILNTISTDLDSCLNDLRREYTTEDIDLWENKARATYWSGLALLADIYLWMGEYDKSEKACDLLINSGQYGLVKKDDWFKNFYPGDTFEIIFQLFYDQLNGQANYMYNWFVADDKIRFTYSTKFFTENVETTPEDIRLLGGSIFEEDSYYKIWKYTGTEHILEGTAKRPTNEHSPNWIFYRYADIVLMKAESCIMLGRANEALGLLNLIRRRAGVDAIESVDFMALTEEYQLRKLYDERCVEFIAEGKSWYDLLRISKRDNYKYKSVLIDYILDGSTIDERPIKLSKLSNPDAHYFPVHQDEIDASGGVLKQNPYYAY